MTGQGAYGVLAGKTGKSLPWTRQRIIHSQQLKVRLHLCLTFITGYRARAEIHINLKSEGSRTFKSCGKSGHIQDHTNRRVVSGFKRYARMKFANRPLVCSERLRANFSITGLSALCHFTNNTHETKVALRPRNKPAPLKLTVCLATCQTRLVCNVHRRICL